MSFFGLDQKDRPTLFEDADGAVQDRQLVALDVDFDERNGLANDAVEPCGPHLLGAPRPLSFATLDGSEAVNRAAAVERHREGCNAVSIRQRDLMQLDIGRRRAAQQLRHLPRRLESMYPS